MIAAPLLALALTACGGGDDSPKPGGGNTSEGGDAAPAVLKCGDFNTAINEMATGSETGGPNVPFKSAFGPDCRFEGTALADGITLDLDKDAPTRDSLEAGTDGWDFSTTEGTHSLYKQIREGEWLECEVPDEYDATGRGDWQPHTAADIAKATSFCADARDLLADAAPQPEGW